MTVENKKILFFDSWTKGIHNFLPIASELCKLGWDSLLVHRGSWGHDTKRPLEEKIGDILCRDILYYRTRFVYQVFKRENPSLVLILTTNYLFDRAVILAARALGIKTCFLMHGIRGVGTKLVSSIKKRPNATLYKKRWLLAGKYFLFIIPNYFLSGLLNNWRFLFRVEPYSIIIKLFLKPHHYVLFPSPSNEIYCDLALVWGNIYKNFFIEEYGYPEDKVKVVGHPPLDSVFKLLNNSPSDEKKQLFFSNYAISNIQPYCVYLEDGSVEQGTNRWTTQTRIEHLKEIAMLCEKAGKDLVIKLHPATDKIPIDMYFKNNNHVHIITIIDLNKLIYYSEAVIGQGSTTNDIAIIMNKPLFLPAWGISKLKSKVTFERQPVAIPCHSPAEFLDCLQHPDKEIFAKDQERKQYTRDFITYTDGKAIDRIVDNIIKAAKTN